LYKKKGTIYPLDYIIHNHDEKLAKKLKLKTFMKNVIMTMIYNVKIEKAKPKLQDVLKMMEGKDKNAVSDKLRLLYQKSDDDGNKLDNRYEKMMTYFDRLSKIYQLQGESLDELTSRLSSLQKRKDGRMKKGASFKHNLMVFREKQDAEIEREIYIAELERKTKDHMPKQLR
jgi:hypothetical protein